MRHLTDARVWLDAYDRDRVRLQFHDGGPILELRDGDTEPREVFQAPSDGWLELHANGECEHDDDWDVEVDDG